MTTMHVMQFAFPAGTGRSDRRLQDGRETVCDARATADSAESLLQAYSDDGAELVGQWTHERQNPRPLHCCNKWNGKEGKTFEHVLRCAQKTIEKRHDLCIEYVSISERFLSGYWARRRYAIDDSQADWWKWRCKPSVLAVYAVEGSNEGYYVYVDYAAKLGDEGDRSTAINLMLIKTCGNFDDAMAIVKFVTRLLDA